MANLVDTARVEKWAILTLLLVVVIRLVSMGYPDIVDTTEGRYASISKYMLETGDYVTPHMPLRQEGWVPYMGKPPLYFWLGSASLKTFGMNAWAARLPSFLSALLLGVIVYYFGLLAFGKRTALISVLAFQSMLVIFVTSSVVMLDMTVAAFMGASLLGFYCIITNKGGTWSQYLFFIGLALGFLTKGPLALVLCGGTIFLWSLIQRDFKWLFKVSWFKGALILGAIILPWFYLAERAQPGFLKYFFMNENFLRFVTRNYQDKYGSGHVYPRGSALVLMIALSIPWSIILLTTLRRYLQVWKGIWQERNPALMLCFAWALFPALFFSAARQITPLYILPCLGGLALCVGYFWTRLDFNPLKAAKLSLILGCVYGLGTVISGPFVSEARSTRGMVEMIYEKSRSHPTVVGVPIGNPFSAYFYSNKGQIELVAIEQSRLLGSPINDVILKKRDLKGLSTEITNYFKSAGEWGKYIWLKRETLPKQEFSSAHK